MKFNNVKLDYYSHFFIYEYTNNPQINIILLFVISISPSSSINAHTIEPLDDCRLQVNKFILKLFNAKLVF